MALTINPYKETPTPAIPATFGLDPSFKQFIDPIKEWIEVRDGRRGDPLDQAVTFRDLLKNGALPTDLSGRIYARLFQNSYQPTFISQSNSLGDELLPPPAPTGLAAFAALANIIVTLDAIDNTVFRNYAYTEIWRSGTNDIGTAVKVGTTNSGIYSDALGQTGATRYYWARHVSTAGMAGPFNATAGVSATSALVLGTNVAVGTLTGDRLVAATITGDKIAASTITAVNIAAATITAALIAAGTLTATQIAAGTITGSNIAAGTITASNLSVTTLSAISANLGTITAGNITLDTAGYINGGQTAYNTGAGFFLGYSGAAYKFSIGDGSLNALTWDGTTLSIVGKLSLDPYTAGSTVLISNTAEKFPAFLGSPALLKQTKFIRAGTLTTYFEAWVNFTVPPTTAWNSSTIYLQTYVNGSPYGTLRSATYAAGSNGGGSPMNIVQLLASWSENASMLHVGDTIEVWGRQVSGGEGHPVQAQLSIRALSFSNGTMLTDTNIVT